MNDLPSMYEICAEISCTFGQGEKWTTQDWTTQDWTTQCWTTQNSRRELEGLNARFAVLVSEEMSCDIVAAQLRGMRPTPSSDKDILKPNGKLKTLNTTD